MKIKIKKNAYVFAGSYQSGGMRDFLKENEGKWLEVETACLFDNQYNTATYRIYDSMVEEIKDDVRHLFKKCKYCGSMVEKTEPDCSKHEDCSKYGMHHFTPENTYFLKYPAGVKMVQHEQILSYQPSCPKFGTYYLENFPSLDYMRLYNCRKTINFKYDGEFFYIHNGIGYKKAKRLDIPERNLQSLKRHLKTL
jgi:hypothetical protein